MLFAPRSYHIAAPCRQLVGLFTLTLFMALAFEPALAADKDKKVGKPTPAKAKEKADPAKANPDEFDPVTREILLQTVACLSTQRSEGVAGLILIGSSKPPDPLEALKEFDSRAVVLYETSQIGAMSNPFGGLSLALVMLNADGSLSRWAEVANQIPFAGTTRPGAVDKPKSSAIEVVVDRSLLMGVEDERPVQGYEQNRWEAQAYNYLVAHSSRVSQAELTKRGRRDITYVHLFEEPEKYRGQIVHVEGFLRRLIRLDAPKILQNDGIKEIYEGWIFDKAVNNHYCVIVTEIPEDFARRIQAGEPFNDAVSFHGYFFKKYRYKTAELDKNKRQVWRDAPLLIGHSLVLPPSGPSATAEMMPIILFTIGGTIVLAVFLAWWFRRGDRAVQSRLANTRNTSFIEPIADGADAGLPASPFGPAGNEFGNAPN